MPSNSCSIFTPEEYLTFNIDTFWHDNVVWWWWWRAVLSLGNIFRAGRFKLDVWIVIWRNPKRQEIRPVRSLAAGKLVGWFPCRRFERRFDVWANRLETADVAVFFLPHFVLTKLQTETEINKWIKGKGGKGNGKGRKRKLAWHVHLLATLNQKSTRLDAGQVLDDVHQIIKVLLSTDRCPPPPTGRGRRRARGREAKPNESGKFNDGVLGDGISADGWMQRAAQTFPSDSRSIASWIGRVFISSLVSFDGYFTAQNPLKMTFLLLLDRAYFEREMT